MQDFSTPMSCYTTEYHYDNFTKKYRKRGQYATFESVSEKNRNKVSHTKQRSCFGRSPARESRSTGIKHSQSVTDMQMAGSERLA
ncbi:hypothetical protein RRG08_005232 [Elysia crispata]|uniref:Uncharacterized protein n=1 Tax=Elysia crispata TaxID=231223 RepID=A0AAE1AP00_9GAST|nr:hypothetical protein RRG08_005232 [Elysia crispata]